MNTNYFSHGMKIYRERGPARAWPYLAAKANPEHIRRVVANCAEATTNNRSEGLPLVLKREARLVYLAGCKGGNRAKRRIKILFIQAKERRWLEKYGKI